MQNTYITYLLYHIDYTLEERTKYWSGEFISHSMLLISKLHIYRALFALPRPQWRTLLHKEVSQYRYKLHSHSPSQLGLSRHNEVSNQFKVGTHLHPIPSNISIQGLQHTHQERVDVLLTRHMIIFDHCTCIVVQMEYMNLYDDIEEVQYEL